MKQLILALVLATVGTSTSFAGGEFTYRCSSKQTGVFNVSFSDRGVQADLDTMIEYSKKPGMYSLTRDEDYEDSEGNLLYTHAVKGGKAEFYFHNAMPVGGGKLKSGRIGGFVVVKIEFYGSLHLPREYTATCLSISAK